MEELLEGIPKSQFVFTDLNAISKEFFENNDYIFVHPLASSDLRMAWFHARMGWNIEKPGKDFIEGVTSFGEYQCLKFFMWKPIEVK